MNVKSVLDPIIRLHETYDGFLTSDLTILYVENLQASQFVSNPAKKQWWIPLEFRIDAGRIWYFLYHTLFGFLMLHFLVRSRSSWIFLTVPSRCYIYGDHLCKRKSVVCVTLYALFTGNCRFGCYQNSIIELLSSAFIHFIEAVRTLIRSKSLEFCKHSLWLDHKLRHRGKICIPILID